MYNNDTEKGELKITNENKTIYNSASSRFFTPNKSPAASNQTF